MTLRKARRIARKLSQSDSILYRERFFGCYGEIDDLQLARNLMIDCFLEIQMSRLRYSRIRWSDLKDGLDSLNVRNYIYVHQQSNHPREQILELYRNMLLQLFQAIKEMLLIEIPANRGLGNH